MSYCPKLAAAAALAVGVWGAAPAHAILSVNSQALNVLNFNALSINALSINALSSEGSALRDLNGVAIEAVILPQ